MPAYTYRCENCGHQFDKRQDFSDKSLEVCPSCGKHTLHKVYFPAGVSFKGSGFYVTDKKKASSIAASNTSKGKENGAKETTKGPVAEKKTPDTKPSTSNEPAKSVPKD